MGNSGTEAGYNYAATQSDQDLGTCAFSISVQEKELTVVVSRRGERKAGVLTTCQVSCLELMIKELYSSAGGISALEAKADVYAEAIQARDRFVRAERSRVCAETFLVCVTSGTITLVSVMA